MSERPALGARRRELVRAGRAAARDARAPLAEAIAVLDAEVAFDAVGRGLAAPLTAVIATLYRAEVGGPEDVRDRLREASVGVARVLQAMHEPEAAGALDRAGSLVARTLAILHPARAELESELARVSEEPGPARPTLEPAEVPAGASIRETAVPAPDPAEVVPAERRSARRVPLETSVGVHAAAQFLGGRTGDLSTGGLFVGTPDPLPVGTLVTISVVLPDGHRVTVDATVTWVRGPHAGTEGMGVKITRVSDADARAIARHLG